MTADVNAPVELEILERRLLEREIAADPRIVHDDVEAPERVQRPLYDGAASCAIGDIARFPEARPPKISVVARRRFRLRVSGPSTKPSAGFARRSN